MAATYREIIRQVGNRINAIAGDTPAGVETAYTVSTFTTTQLDNPAFTPSILNDAVLSAQSQIVKAICETAQHPWRGLYITTTSPVASGSPVPVVDNAGKQIIGPVGSIRDSSNNVALTEVDSYDYIRRLLRSISNGDIVNPIYLFALSGELIYHTRTNVLIEVCSYDHAAELTAIATPSNPVKVPEAMVAALVSGAIFFVATNENPGLLPMATSHGQFFGSSIQLIQQGSTLTDRHPDKT